MVNLYQGQCHAGMTVFMFAVSAVEMLPSIIIVLSLVALFSSKLRRQTIMGRLYPTSRSPVLS